MEDKAKSRKITFKEIRSAVYRYFKKHWFQYAVITSFPSLWFPLFIDGLGKTLNLRNGNDEYTKFGILLSLIIVLPIFIINIAKTHRDYYRDIENEINAAYNHQLVESFCSVFKLKKSRLRKVLHKVNNKTIEVPTIVTNPTKQLNKIVDELKNSLCITMSTLDYKFSNSDFNITIAYNFPCQRNDWFWLSGLSDNAQDVNKLIHSPNSTYGKMIQYKENYYYNNSKENAAKEGHYLLNIEDETNQKNQSSIGSIYCQNYKIANDDLIYVDAYLTITTKIKQFTIGDDDAQKTIRQNMNYMLTEIFGNLIVNELCLLSIDELKTRP